MDRAFFDTNVLLYAHDSRYPQKRKAARELLERHARERSAVLSTQVLQELFVNAVKKLQLPVAAAKELLSSYGRFNVVQVSPELILGAVDLHAAAQFSFWDALVVRAASVGNCAVLYTEDLNDGQTVDGVRIVNPFDA